MAYVVADPTPATRSYLRIKAKSAEAAGCTFTENSDPSFFTHADVAIVQLPTDTEGTALLEGLPKEKDADVLSKNSRDAFLRGDTDALLPPVVAAVREIFTTYNIQAEGKHAVVLGDGWLVGNPCATWLTQQGALVTTLTKESENKNAALRAADIVISGIGVPHLITPDLLKEGVVLIDAGTSEANGELAGDADPLCAEKCALFTPVPGGVGPIAVACLFENAVTLTERGEGNTTTRS
jgi:methylenetetrahydrofolate dehydrogenase (NADP+)/methenyltetrahydrofolate cyclohydrolase